MACEIKNGKYFAPNGKESNLYKELKTIVGEEKAKDLFVLAYSPTFQKAVVNPLLQEKRSKIPALKEGVSFTFTDVNKIKTLHIHEGKKKVGRIQLVDYKDGYKIKSVLVNENKKGEGFGKALYVGAIRKAFIEGKKIYSDLYRTEEADRIWQSLEKEGLTDGKVISPFTDAFDSNDEIKAEKVIEFARKTNEIKTPLSNVEQVEVGKYMQEFESSVDYLNALEKAFYTNGLFSPTTKSLKPLYSSYEIENILSSPELMGKIKETIEKLKNTEEFFQPTMQETTTLDEVGIVGKLKTEEIFTEPEFTISVIDENGQNIVDNPIILETAVKVVDNPKIVSAINALNNAHPNVDTTKLEAKTIKWLQDYGYDFPTLPKAILSPLQAFIQSPTTTNTKNLVDAYREVFNEPEQVRQFPHKQTDKDLVYLETNKSEQQLFDELSLVQTDVENVYHKIEKVDFQELKNYLNNQNISEVDAYKEYYGYKSPQKTIKEIVNLPLENFDYLTDEFIADFNIEIIKNKENSFFNKFKITERGIELKNESPLIISELKAHILDGVKYAKEIQEYSLISKHLPNLSAEEFEVLDEKYLARLQAVNNPSSLKTPTTTERLTDTQIAVKNETEEFINVNNSVYELQTKEADKSIYKRIETNTNLNYFTTPQIVEDYLKPLKVSKPTLASYNSTKKLYKTEELEDNFSCI